MAIAALLVASRGRGFQFLKLHGIIPCWLIGCLVKNVLIIIKMRLRQKRLSPELYIVVIV